MEKIQSAQQAERMDMTLVAPDWYKMECTTPNSIETNNSHKNEYLELHNDLETHNDHFSARALSWSIYPDSFSNTLPPSTTTTTIIVTNTDQNSTDIKNKIAQELNSQLECTNSDRFTSTSLTHSIYEDDITIHNPLSDSISASFVQIENTSPLADTELGFTHLSSSGSITLSTTIFSTTPNPRTSPTDVKSSTEENNSVIQFCPEDRKRAVRSQIKETQSNYTSFLLSGPRLYTDLLLLESIHFPNICNSFFCDTLALLLLHLSHISKQISPLSNPDDRLLYSSKLVQIMNVVLSRVSNKFNTKQRLLFFEARTETRANFLSDWKLNKIIQDKIPKPCITFNDSNPGACEYRIDIYLTPCEQKTFELFSSGIPKLEKEHGLQWRRGLAYAAAPTVFEVESFNPFSKTVEQIDSDVNCYLNIDTVFSSKASPILLSLSRNELKPNLNSSNPDSNQTENERSKFERIKSMPRFIYKTEDNLSQDLGVQILFTLFNQLFKCSQNVFKINDKPTTKNPYINTYSILPITSQYGYIEMKESTTEYSNIDWSKWSKEIDKSSVKNLVNSAVGGAVACHVLGVRDRHHGNILLNNKHEFIPIDFGFLWGKTPRIDAPSFNIAPEMRKELQSLGVWKDYVERCVRSWEVLREKGREIVECCKFLFRGLGVGEEGIVEWIEGAGLMLKYEGELEALGKEIAVWVETAPESWGNWLKQKTHQFKKYV
eukprot:TRINITY_DN2766_c0_g1_i1.p1 TRINITY_DN2766_c0_g1~~TRINITY_DN2766_c0_g1_i1.p1  ORF type:complete len:718 (-),score=147.90 TRINITY_DN2766_c0_g1_i1:48-2201(-)